MADEEISALFCPVWGCATTWRRRQQLVEHLHSKHDFAQVVSALADAEVLTAAVKLPSGRDLRTPVQDMRASAFLAPREQAT